MMGSVASAWRHLRSRRLGDQADRAWQAGDGLRAIELYKKALRFDRQDAGAMGNLAALYLGLGRKEEAERLLEAAIAVSPKNPGLYVNLGNLRLMVGDFPLAVQSYQEALRIDPRNRAAYGNCFRAYMETCDWAGFEHHLSGLLVGRDSGDPDWASRISAYMSLLVPLNRRDQLAVAREAACAYQSAAGRSIRGLGGLSDRLTIAYLSSDFYDHATMHLAAGLFENHDRSRFRVLAYSIGHSLADRVTERIRAACDEFRDVAALSATGVARALSEAGVDILVDLKGYCGGSRPEILALRPAPIQVSFLGYPGTMGATFIDYLIADRVVVPDAHFDAYSEHVIWMPRTYQVTDDRQAIAADVPSRRDYGLPAHSFVFCSFNQSYKIDRASFAAWMTILKAVPEAVLWVLVNNSLAMCSLVATAEGAGIDPKRIVFARPEKKDRHLARLALADLMLDTFVVNGHTTTTDALWAGLPVLTLQGETFASRVASSVLAAYGLDNLICRTEQEYIDTAIMLASEPDYLTALRRDRASHRVSYGLFDTRGYARDIEKAYTMMFDLHQAGCKPRGFAVN